MNATVKRNYREDFSLLLELKDAQGAQMQLPSSADFSLRFSSGTPCRDYSAGRRGGEFFNCHEADDGSGRLHVIFSRHGLGPGALEGVLEYEADDACFPGGRRRVVRPFTTGVALTSGPSDGAAAVETGAVAAWALLTAYDMAVNGGYEGSREEYAAALSAMPDAVAAAETTAKAFKEGNAELGRQIETCRGLERSFGQMQPKLSSSATVSVNADSTLSVTEAAEKALFIKMWNKEFMWYYEGHDDYRKYALAKYDAAADEFVVNPGKGDHEVRLTYEEAIEVWNASHGQRFPYMGGRRARAQVWTSSAGGAVNESSNAAYWGYCPNLEVIGHPDLKPTLKLTGANPTAFCLFALDKKLRHINLILDFSNGGKEHGHWAGRAFRSCDELTTVYLYRICQSLWLGSSSKISYESMRYMVDNCTRTSSSSAIAVTVHPTVWNKLTGNTEDADVAAMTEDERTKWAKIVTDAAAKNLTFAKE